MPTFSVRCIFLWSQRDDQAARHLYEERITLWQATNIDEALRLAEDEAHNYSADGVKYLNFAQGYGLYDNVEAHGTEVFSLLRESNLEPYDYIASFFDTKQERIS